MMNGSVSTKGRRSARPRSPFVLGTPGFDSDAMLAGAAKLLADRRGDFAGRVAFMFQPGEEGHHGARFMLEEGLLEQAAGGGEAVSMAFAIHQTPVIPSGLLATRGSALLASADELLITTITHGHTDRVRSYELLAAEWRRRGHSFQSS